MYSGLAVNNMLSGEYNNMHSFARLFVHRNLL